MTRHTQKQKKSLDWETIQKDIYRRTKRVFKIKQSGGGIITVGSSRFEYYEDKSDGLFFIKGGKPTCFTVQMEETRGQKYAIITEIFEHDNCALDGSTESANIVRAAVELAKQYGALWVDLTDNSGICSKTHDFSIHLSDYYFLTRGKTWYETIFPFVPKYPEEIDDARQQIMNISWDTVIANGKRRYNKQRIQKMLEELPITTMGINTSSPGSAMTVLRTIPYEKRCVTYHKYSTMLLNSIGIQSLYASEWYLPLTDSPINRTHNLGVHSTNMIIEKED
jgi:hypothetical protein